MRWPPYKHVFFDCDSTLTTIEGIDVLAQSTGKQWRIEVLTNAAMNGDLDLADVYGKRLRAVRPTREQVSSIRRVYKRNVVEDARAVIEVLHNLGHYVYIISGGLAEPVEEFGIYLGVPRERIRAVELAYNSLTGKWWETSPTELQEKYRDYEEGALTISNGKAKIVRELLGDAGGRAVLVGDGSSDLMASHAVDLFVGYGGVVAREKVMEGAPISIRSASLAPMLLLAAGPAAVRRLRNTPYESTFSKGFELWNRGAITFQNERLKRKFTNACQAVYSRTD